MTDTAIGRTVAAFSLAIVIHAIPLALIRLPEYATRSSRGPLVIRIREIPERPATQTDIPVLPETREANIAESVPPEPPTRDLTETAPIPAVVAPPESEQPESTEAPVAENPADTGAELTVQRTVSSFRETTAPEQSSPVGEPAASSPLLSFVEARRTPPPDYPDSAREEGREGAVEIELTLDTRGRVLTAEIIGSSGHADLDATARAAVLHWRFERGDEGRRTRRRFEFRLENSYTP